MTLDFDDEDVHLWLTRTCAPYGVSPSSSLDAEDYFRVLLNSYIGSPDPLEMTAWLSQRLEQDFRSVKEKPRWIQSPEWPFADGKPMVFAGQIDVNKETSSVDFYHDDASLYVFIGRKVPPVVVTQRY